MIKLNEVMSVVVNVNQFTIIVVFRCNVNADNSVADGFVAVDEDLVFVRLVVQSLDFSLDFEVLLLVLVDRLVDSVVDVDDLGVEVGVDVWEDDLVDGYSRNYEIVVLVSGERLLVALEELDHTFVELVEGWVAY